MNVEFYTQLLVEANADPKPHKRTWHDSSWANDACGSIMCEIDGNNETYVQLFAFDDPEEAKLEGLTIYGVVISRNGKTDYNAFDTDDRALAIERANLAVAEVEATPDEDILDD